MTRTSVLSDAAGAVLTDEIDLVYRSEATRGDQPAKSGIGQPTGTCVASVTPSAVTLFRYSALTFNGHRIHYDADYCREVEGYPGPIVHGPLLATWLAGAIAQASGGSVASFSYRAVSPTTLGARLDLLVSQSSEGWQGVAARADGGVAMTAHATLR